MCPSGGQPSGSLADISVDFNGTTFATPDTAYNDQKGFGSFNYPKGTYAYDVTSEVTGSGDYTAVIENVDPTNCTIPLGEMLFVVYEDPSQNPDNYIQLWVMEGCDLVKGDSDYCVTTDESTATATFTGIAAPDFTSAELITVVAQGAENGNNLLFNGNIVKTDAWNLSSEAGTPSTNAPEYDDGSNIFVEVVDVTAYMTSSDNTVGYQDTGTAGMQPSNGILVVRGGLPSPLISCDASGSEKNEFAPNETVYVKGIGLSPNTNYTLWIQDDAVIEGDTLNATEDPSGGSQEEVMTDAAGNFGVTAIWSIPPGATPTWDHYDIIADDKDAGTQGTYNAADDYIDSAVAYGVTAPVPELATFALVGAGLAMVVGLVRFKRRR